MSSSNEKLVEENAWMRNALEAMENDLANLQADVLAKNRQLGKLKAEKRKALEGDPATAKVREVLEFWQSLGHERSKIPMDGERADKTRTQLKNWSADELKLALENASKDPFYMGQNDRNTRYDDPVTVFKSEKSVERLLGFDKPASVTPIRQVPAELQQWLAKCECGHTRMEHSYPLQPLWVPENMVGWEPCRECDCMDWGSGYGVCERRAVS